MARTVLERELTLPRTGRACFAVATEADDEEIRRLLHDNPMAGQISISTEREPDFFADAHLPAQSKQTIISRDENRLVCAGSCTIRERFVNGESRRVGYLGGLRLDAGQAGRFDILRRGYEFFHQLQASAPADFYFTSIAADNKRARKFLERGPPGMPRYEFIGDFVTLLLAVPQRNASPRHAKAAAGDIVAQLNSLNQRYQFAPSWSVQELFALESLGLRFDKFEVHRAALWDQRAYKQNVIRGYDRRLSAARPLLNLAAKLMGGPELPAVGQTLATAFISHLAIGADEPKELVDLIAGIGCQASHSGIEILTLGFAANDPRLATVRRNFRCREYCSCLYVVSWPDCGGSARELDDRIPAPEVALL
jgi:hypothetical protein